jgi:glycosyltransferase involved in cell wall biosynthesis
VKILYHHRTLAKDGMGVHIQEMVAALHHRGHQVLVVGPRETDSPTTGTERPIRQMLPTAISELAELAYDGLALRRLQTAYASFRPDILYERYNLFLLAGMRLSRMHGVPMLLEINSPLAYERLKHENLAWRQLAHRLETKVWTAADAVLPVSHALADIVRGAGVTSDRIQVVPNGVDLRRFSTDISGVEVRRELGLGSHVVLGFTGFVRQWHGLDRVLEVMANCGPAQELYLLIVGDGPAKADLKQVASRLGVAERVRFVGPIDHSEIPAYVAVFDIALQPSAVAYASPLKLMEYMAMGKAIIAPDQPNIRELITDKETGLLVMDGDTKGLAEAIALLVTNAELRLGLGRRAAQKVCERGLTWEANAERVEAVADQLFRSRVSPS